MFDTDFRSRQRVLLTGHAGFKGSWASLWLERLGAEVAGYAPAKVKWTASRYQAFDTGEDPRRMTIGRIAQYETMP